MVAVLDSNCDPQGIDYPVPGNDDAARAIALYCDLVARAVIEGLAKSQSSYSDVGAAAEPLAEDVPADEVLPEAALIDDPVLAAEMGVLPEGEGAQA